MNPIKRTEAIFEILALGAVFAFAKLVWANLEAGFVTPGTVFILAGLVLIWALQRRRGAGLAALGLRRPESWKIFTLVFLGTLGLTFVIGVFGVPMLQGIFGDTDVPLVPESSTVPLFLIWLRIMVTAAFGEEVVFRGFLLGRLESLFSGAPFATGLAVLAQAILFGLAHYASGMVTVITAGLIGLVFGAAYIRGGRNLWPLILVHAIPDTISLLQS